ncbi:DUF2510 domain-containing protein [Schumannella sp. 10F1B-5-1]|uniref:DUF2510 domain-containing protein n=1 Tax=Schumannella sp. 10F1B-5-1 TaxID=2590780 RepID=UPI0011310BC5|nr:DUF2510 domain-containing protein [Schumannella sp. 10F1B-5-1]TPW70754.1 DUF2510 domain-containing protein [Schumannella sp. 10F1B-5-1]
MTDLAVRLPVAGWYKDPASAERLRWWTGETWSQHTIERPTPQQETDADEERRRRRAAHRAEGEPDVAVAAREASLTEPVTTGEIAAFIAAETGQTDLTTVADHEADDAVVLEPAAEPADETEDVEAEDVELPADQIDPEPVLAEEIAAPVADAELPVDRDDAPVFVTPAAEAPVADSIASDTSAAETPAPPRAVSLVPEVMATSANSPLLEQLAAAPPPVAPSGDAPGTAVALAASGVSFDELMKQLPFATGAGEAAADAVPDRRRSVQTAGAWLLALLPVLALIPAAGALVGTIALPDVADYLPLAAGGLTIILGLLFAAADASSLAKRGVEKRVTPIVGLLTPLPYLALRAVSLARQKRLGGVAPLVVLVLLLGAGAAAYVLFGAQLPTLLQLAADQARALLGL